MEQEREERVRQEILGAAVRGTSARLPEPGGWARVRLAFARSALARFSAVTGLLIAITLIVMFIVGEISEMRKTPEQRAEEAKAQATAPAAERKSLRLSVAASFTDLYLAVKNQDDFDWTNVTLTLSSSVLSDFYKYRLSRVSAGQGQLIRLAQFIQSDGKRFDPTAYKARFLTVSADTLNGHGSWAGQQD